jgi:hypothetical protein
MGRLFSFQKIFVGKLSDGLGLQIKFSLQDFGLVNGVDLRQHIFEFLQMISV